MRTGAIISATLHSGLVLFLMFGDTYRERQDDTEFVAANVSLISLEELAALQLPPDLPDEPELVAPVPEPAVQEEQESEAPPPDIAAETEPETDDGTGEREAVAVVEELAPDAPEEPARQAAPVVAPEAAPESDARSAEIEREAVAAEPEVEEQVIEDAQTETAPEHAATETVTEADQTTGFALDVERPRRRPKVQAASPDADDWSDIEDLIAQAQEVVPESQEPQPEPVAGPSLTAAERDGLRRKIQNCWNLASMSDEARHITVTVGAELDETGRVLEGSIRQVDVSEGSAIAQGIAFEAGRRAIALCLSRGHDLPREKFDSWRFIEVVFDPENMRLR